MPVGYIGFSSLHVNLPDTFVQPQRCNPDPSLLFHCSIVSSPFILPFLIILYLGPRWEAEAPDNAWRWAGAKSMGST